MEYAEQTMEILRDQLVKKGENPLQYIPLARIKAELDSIFAAANAGQPYDEGRLDYLLTCMDVNPEYKREKQLEDEKWRESMREYSTECLQIMRGFIPPTIFSASVGSLKAECRYSQDLAKRLFTKKCLWLVRVMPSDIEKMHIAELQGRFNPQAQGLDIVELAAVFAAIPINFGKDHKKEAWRLSLEKQLKDFDSDKQKGKLVGAKLRHSAYKNQTPLFGENEQMHTMQAVSSEDAFKPRDSFKHYSSRAAESSALDEEEQDSDGGGDSVLISYSEAPSAAKPSGLSSGSSSKPITERENFNSLAAQLNASLLKGRRNSSEK